MSGSDKPPTVGLVAMQAVWLRVLFGSDMMRDRPRGLLRFFAWFLVNSPNLIGTPWQPVLHAIMRDYLKATKGVPPHRTRDRRLG